MGHAGVLAAIAERFPPLERDPDRRRSSSNHPDLTVVATEALRIAIIIPGSNLHVVRELVRRGDNAGLLRVAEQHLAAGTRWPRDLLQHGLGGLPAEEVVPEVHGWFARFPGSPAPLALSAVGVVQDVPLLLQGLDRLMDEQDWSAAVAPVRALSRLRASEAEPALERAWAETTYSYREGTTTAPVIASRTCS